MTELDRIEQALREVQAAQDGLHDAVMAAYRAEDDEGRPRYTLEEIGQVLGVTRQRVYQLVRSTR